MSILGRILRGSASPPPALIPAESDLRGRRRPVRRRPCRAIDPAALAADVVLFLPDRHARLDLVDDVSARVECRPAMGGAHADPDGAVADREGADAMLGVYRQHFEALARLREDPLPFRNGDRLVRLVLERGDALAVIVIADPTFERHAGARAVVAQARLECPRIDGAAVDLEAHLIFAAHRRC